MNTASTITAADFASAFGVAELPATTQRLIADSDFNYRPLDRDERKQVIREIVAKLDANAFTKVGAHRKEVWEKGWAENLQGFTGKEYELEELLPRFIRPNPIMRWNQDFVRVDNPRFEYDFFRIFRDFLFQEFLPEADAVYEFGCGSGYNLVALAQMFPKKKLHGLDWSEAAVETVNLAAQKHYFNLEGRRFDFFAPDPSVQMAPRSVAMTMCALEQVGVRFEEFLQFLLQQSPMLVIHWEPMLDLYDPNNEIDRLAIRYHTQRGYLTGYLTRLRQESRIEILKTRRLKFGSLYHEGYSYVVWRSR